MTRTELIKSLEKKNLRSISYKDMELIVKSVFEYMVEALLKHNRIEIRGLGSFELRYREQRESRNPQTGEKIVIPGKFIVHFKPGKALRERVNAKFSEH